MYKNVTEQFATTIRSPSRTFNLRLNVEGTWIDAGFKKMTYENASCADEYLQLGSTVAAKIELTIKKSDILFDGIELPLEIGLLLPDGTYEYVPVGIFKAEHPTSDQYTTTFTAYDRMIQTTGLYASELEYPASAVAVMNEISEGCGIPVNNEGLEDIIIDTKPNGYVYREMIGYIASLAGGFACVDRTGTIVIKWYEDNDVVYNLSRIMSFEKDEGEFKLEKLTCNVDSSTTYTSGDGLLGITLDNPFMPQAKLEKVYAKLKGFTYRGATIKALGDIRLDPWDIITVEDGEDVYKIPVMNIVQEYDGGMSMTISSYSKTKTEEEIDFKGPSITEKERTYTEIQETKNLLVEKVDADYVNSRFTKTEDFEATNAKIRKIESEKLSAKDAELKYANIDFTNIGKAAMEYFYSMSGLIKNVTVGDQTITGELVGVTIKGDIIEGNTIVADKLVIKGEDGLYYKLNTDGITTEAQQTDYNSLNGQVIRAKSVTASKIDVKDLVAFDATIAGFNIENTAIYSTGKESATSGVRGIYLSKDGQMAVGDSKHYIKYYKDTDGLYKLKISADALEFSTGGSVEDAIGDLKNELDSVKEEIVSIISISSSKGNVFKNTNVSTVLSVTIFRGTQRITNIEELKATYGESAYLQWKSQEHDGDTYLEIPAIDERISEGGFKFTISPNDIDTKGIYTCDLITD
jgi:hypothetical protein